MENNNKRLERSRTNRVIAGVCAGLADYFNIDIALMRVLFVVATICGSFGFWMYVILWIVVPEENILGPGNQQSYGDTIDITPKDHEEKTGSCPAHGSGDDSKYVHAGSGGSRDSRLRKRLRTFRGGGDDHGRGSGGRTLRSSERRR